MKITKLTVVLDSWFDIGTTKRGIGPAYSTKSFRNGIRVGELFDFGNFSKKYELLVSFFQKYHSFEYDVAENCKKYRVSTLKTSGEDVKLGVPFPN